MEHLVFLFSAPTNISHMRVNFFCVVFIGKLISIATALLAACLSFFVRAQLFILTRSSNILAMRQLARHAVPALPLHMSPEWLIALLTEKFFVPCAAQHVDSNSAATKKNETNIFCLDCMSGICQPCVSWHHSHRLLQIRRYVYHDVVRLHDMQKLFDCARVQTYVNNGAKVVFLNERPQPKSSRSSGSTCAFCHRNLQDCFSFCSVACKVDAIFFNQGSDHYTIKHSSKLEGAVHHRDMTSRNVLTKNHHESEAAIVNSFNPRLTSNNSMFIEYVDPAFCYTNGDEDHCSYSTSPTSSADSTDESNHGWDQSDANATSRAIRLRNPVKQSNSTAITSPAMKKIPSPHLLEQYQHVVHCSQNSPYKLSKFELSNSPRSVIIGPPSLNRRKSKPLRSRLC